MQCQFNPPEGYPLGPPKPRGNLRPSERSMDDLLDDLLDKSAIQPDQPWPRY